MTVINEEHIEKHGQNRAYMKMAKNYLDKAKEELGKDNPNLPVLRVLIENAHDLLGEE